jgi:hypothetical protein
MKLKYFCSGNGNVYGEITKIQETIIPEGIGLPTPLKEGPNQTKINISVWLLDIEYWNLFVSWLLVIS